MSLSSAVRYQSTQSRGYYACYTLYSVLNRVGILWKSRTTIFKIVKDSVFVPCHIALCTVETYEHHATKHFVTLESWIDDNLLRVSFGCMSGPSISSDASVAVFSPEGHRGYGYPIRKCARMLWKFERYSPSSLLSWSPQPPSYLNGQS